MKKNIYYNEAAVTAMTEAITFLTVAFNTAKALRDVDRTIRGYANGEAYWSLDEMTDKLRDSIEAYTMPLKEREDRVYHKLLKEKLRWCEEFNCYNTANAVRQPLMELYYWIGKTQVDYIWN